MQPVGPYQFIEAVSLCQVGSVWSAIDGQGNSYTVAVLDAAVAGDQRWREAFVGTAHALAQPGAAGPRYVHAEFAAPAPWVAYAASETDGGERLFTALGMECRPAQEQLGDDDSPTMKTTVSAPTTAAATANGSPVPDDEELASPTTRLTPSVPPPNPWQAGPPQSTPPVIPGPTSAPPHQTSAPPHQTSAPPHQTSAPPHQVSVPPHQSSGPPYQVSVPPDQGSAPPYQNSAPPYQISGPPDSISGPPQPLPEMPRPYSAEPSTESSSYDPLYSPVRHIVPSEPEPRRNWVWILVAVVVVLVLGGGGTVLAVSLSGEGGGGEDPPAETKPTASSLPPPPQTNPPLQPGLEPPTPGAWPTKWPTFTERDKVRTLPGLEGLTFTVKVPASWQCVLSGRAQGFTKYNCGVPPGSDKPEFGGELVVRDCAQPCDEAQQVAMRQAEEAWGKRWIRSGQNSAFLETNTLQENGEARHGLVVVAYFQSGTGEATVDRQLVLRMTAPVDGAQELRRVATYLRETLIF
ncbi:ribosomal eL19 family protein [Plantactinospora endophytica]|uniref:DUF3558 domain-containing protein n=1 Tax=Plantactinospora endophytica TaxID=673535 RepID=A0ABQ4E9G1_9ACTN|nr:hypothetical protein [Plantactinospora endophytica]GIG91365.1 hypothetical protein Pen02_63010 [Plantactinospora endophytica]